MSTTTITTTHGFDRQGWQERCVHLAIRATNACGSVYERYQQLFSAAVDDELRTLPEQHHRAALEQACRWDYLSPQARAQVRPGLAEAHPHANP